MAEPRGAGTGQRLTASTSILTLGVGLLALFLGYEWFWMVFALGWAVATPLVAILTGRRGPAPEDAWSNADASRGSTDHASASDSKADALETLRSRYARGELSDVAFERKLEQLLRTETLEDVRRTVESDVGSDPARAREGERAGVGENERDRSREGERERTSTGEPDR